MERKSKQQIGKPGSVVEKDWGDDWVHELIAKTRPGVEIEFPDWLISPARRAPKAPRPL